MNADVPDRSTAARLASASERLSILVHELDIVLTGAAATGADVQLLAGVGSRLRSQALDIAEISFAVAEDAVSWSGDARAERSAAALGRIARIIEPVFEIASELAAHLVLCGEQAARAGQPLATSHLRALDDPIVRLLTENEHLITGAGVAIAPNALTDRELWMQWWVNGPDGAAQLLPQLDRVESRFYDYPSAVWFREPVRAGAPRLAPPHFDHGGTNTWMVTAAIPVVVREQVVGLACAELTLARIGALAAPALEAMPTPVALVSPEGLVVASTHSEMHPGARVDDQRWERHAGEGVWFAEVSPGVTVARSPALAWMIVADSTPRL